MVAQQDSPRLEACASSTTPSPSKMDRPIPRRAPRCLSRLFLKAAVHQSRLTWQPRRDLRIVAVVVAGRWRARLRPQRPITTRGRDPEERRVRDALSTEFVRSDDAGETRLDL